MVKTDEIIKLNKKFGGSLINRGSLDFAVSRANREKNIYKSNAYLIRGIIVDHSFIDGNKRSATGIVLKRFKKKGITCDKVKFGKGIVSIAKNNISSINKIERRLRKWCKK